jgi:hypothetical protein
MSNLSISGVELAKGEVKITLLPKVELSIAEYEAKLKKLKALKEELLNASIEWAGVEIEEFEKLKDLAYEASEEVGDHVYTLVEPFLNDPMSADERLLEYARDSYADMQMHEALENQY